jgi:hypothetical protein
MVRWTANLNLMELSGIVGDADAFNRYARELMTAPLGSWVKAHFLLFFGEGLQRFQRVDEAESMLRDAISYAESHEYHQVAFKAQEVLAAVRSAPQVRRPVSSTPVWTEQEVAPVARALSELLKTAVAAA